MTIGPAPMIRMELMSVRLGMLSVRARSRSRDLRAPEADRRVG